MSEASTRVPSCRKSTSLTKNIDSTHTHTKPWPWNWVWHSVTLPKTRCYIPQNWWLEDYLPIRLCFFLILANCIASKMCVFEMHSKHVWHFLKSQRSRDSWSFPPRSLTLRIHQSHIIMTHLRCFVKKQPKNVTIFWEIHSVLTCTPNFAQIFLDACPSFSCQKAEDPKNAAYSDFSILASCRTQTPWPHSDKSKDSGHIHSLNNSRNVV